MIHRRVFSPPGSRSGKLSLLRRLAHLALAVALSSITLIAVLLGGVARASIHASPPAPEGQIPAGRPSSDGPIVVAVVLGRSGTDDADALAPYEVFATSTKFSVYTVAATSAPATMNGGLHVVPTYTFADIASGAARQPDLVVVPAVNDPAGKQEAELRAWIVRQADAGARILSICAGSRVLAATGLLDGRRATSHWSRIAPLKKSNPRVNWVAGQRYVEDGNITTSAAISSGIPASLHLMQELAGTAEAAKVAQQVRYPGWTIGGPTEIPIQHFSSDDVGVGLGAVLPWFQPTLAVGVADGVYRDRPLSAHRRLQLRLSRARGPRRHRVQHHHRPRRRPPHHPRRLLPAAGPPAGAARGPLRQRDDARAPRTGRTPTASRHCPGPGQHASVSMPLSPTWRSARAQPSAGPRRK